MRIALLSCTKSKRSYPCKAKELYSPSTYFSLAHKYASIVSDKIYILSAKHGLLKEDDIVEPYNETLNDKSHAQRKEWGSKVIAELSVLHNLETDEFIILTGKSYYESIINNLNNVTLPLLGLPFGKKLSKLEKLINMTTSENACDMLHMKFNSMPHYTWEQINEIPFESGIYIMFEEGEKYKGYKRITRVGTHRSDGRLKGRLKNHFRDKNKNGSIFRKNIGRASLNKYNDPYLEIWNMDPRPNGPQAHLAHLVDKEKELELEQKISNYLQRYITFTCFEVETKQERLRLEEGIIATLNCELEFIPSPNWKGLYSPIKRIRNSGMWLVEGLDKEQLTADELKRILDGDNSRNQFSTEPRKALIKTSNPSSTQSPKEEVTKYIVDRKLEAKEKGLNYIDLVSGDIHKALRYSNRMPSVCGTMYSCMNPGDEILHTMPSGKSSTIKIRYYVA